MLNRLYKLLFIFGAIHLSFSSVIRAEIRFSTGPISAPKIQFEENSYEFGRVWQGAKVTHKFNFRNVGNADLILGEVKPTCGCTAAVASTGPFRPGESGSIELTYDSHGKVGLATKDAKVFSNDPDSPHPLVMEGLVFSETHMDKSSADVIFTGSCAECHSLPSKNKTGQALYESACYICHDFPQSAGKKPIAADMKSLAQMSKKHLKRATSQGIPNTSMPGFHNRSGGPLSKEQIDSLIEFLNSIKSQK